MKFINPIYFKKPEKHIPYGFYCYDSNTEKDCPFWDFDETRSEQHNGYCYYLGKGDWELNKEYEESIVISYSINKEEIGKLFKDVIGEGVPHSLLWDQCKECNINE